MAAGKHDNYPTEAFRLHSVAAFILWRAEKDDLNTEHGTNTIARVLGVRPPVAAPPAASFLIVMEAFI
jgi:hypothetical protein